MEHVEHKMKVGTFPTILTFFSTPACDAAEQAHVEMRASVQRERNIAQAVMRIRPMNRDP